MSNRVVENSEAVTDSPFRGQRGLRIIVAGGGTGGHIFPAVAIANAIRKLKPGTEFLFVGAIFLANNCLRLPICTSQITTARHQTFL